MAFQPRRWQIECHDHFRKVHLMWGRSRFVYEACPGSGKSAMAAWMADTILRDDEFQERFLVSHVIALVPWASIQGSPDGPGGPTGLCRAFADRGLSVRTQFLVPGIRSRQPVPHHFHASILTYNAAKNPEVLETIRLWRREMGDWRFALILDEIHHTRTQGDCWGELAAALAEEAAITIAMSGTYFRGDGHPIQFLDYELGRPVTDYRYTYTQGLLDRCVRPVAFRRFDFQFNLFDSETGQTVRHDMRLSSVVTDEHLGAAKRKVLDPGEQYITELIRDAHQHLSATRTRFPNAGCLIVCQPGGGEDGEDRYIERVAAVVERVTGEPPVKITYHDPDDVSAAKLADFRSGSAPYLVAVNKVSEGCDIPRIRSVVFCRYTESEMLFRQIVGRALRWTADDDGTAAMVHMPAFPKMVAFAANLEGDCLQAIRERKSPDVTERDESSEPTKPTAPKLIAVDMVAVAAGGIIGGETVRESYIQVAEELAQSQPSFAHSNRVQLGQAMQFWDAKNGSVAGSQPAAISPDRSIVEERIVRAVKRLANNLHAVHNEKRFGIAWTREFEDVFRISFTAAKQQWSTERLEKAAEQLERKCAMEARRESH